MSAAPSALLPRRLAAIVVATAVLLALAPGAGAAGVYATWTLDTSGGPGHETGTVAFGVLGAPRATFTSKITGSAPAPELLELSTDDTITAASAWGQVLGASTGKQYLWTKHHTNAATLTRTTTYTFASPMPTGAFYVALGDVDFDAVDVTAKGASGTALTGAQIKGPIAPAGFNFTYPGARLRAVVVVKPGRLAVTAPPDPDVDGIAAWMRPSRRLASLTTVSHRNDDFPGRSTVRTWLAVMAHAVRGRVTVATTAGSGVAGAVVRLRAADGTLLGTTRTGADGSFAFPKVYAADGYRLRVAAPSGYAVAGSEPSIVDIARGDAMVRVVVVHGAPPPVTG